MKVVEDFSPRLKAEERTEVLDYFFRQTVTSEVVHWNLRAVSRIRKGSSARRSSVKEDASVDSSHSKVPLTGQFRGGVNSSSHVHGVASTSSPPGFTKAGSRANNFSGSGRRQSRFAA